MIDLGWDNNLHCRPEIDQWLAKCQAQNHRRSDEDELSNQFPYRGMGHLVVCEKCGFRYHYDSSD